MIERCYTGRGTMTICKAPGCDKKAIVKHYCKNHYNQWMTKRRNS